MRQWVYFRCYKSSARGELNACVCFYFGVSYFALVFQLYYFSFASSALAITSVLHLWPLSCNIYSVSLFLSACQVEALNCKPPDIESISVMQKHCCTGHLKYWFILTFGLVVDFDTNHRLCHLDDTFGLWSSSQGSFFQMTKLWISGITITL